MSGALFHILIGIYLLPLAGAVCCRVVLHPSVAFVRRTILASLCCSVRVVNQLLHRPRVEVLFNTINK